MMSRAHNHIWNSTEAVLLCGLDGIRWLSVLDSRSSMVLAETETDHKNCTKCLWIAQNAKVHETPKVTQGASSWDTFAAERLLGKAAHLL